MNTAVVIPVGPQTEHLRGQLTALAAQQILPETTVEVVLSCNGSDPVTVRALAAEIVWPRAWHLRTIDSSERRGPSHARNAGWRATNATRVLFCDADDVVSPHWLTGLYRALDSADVAGGLFEYERLNPTGVGGWGEVGSHNLPRKFRHLQFVPSGNLAVRRSVLEALEGFDESLDRSEDVDFSWRAAYTGARVALAPDALLSVRRRETRLDLFAQAHEDARFDVPLLTRHRAHGAQWSPIDLCREAAGVAVALVQAPLSRGHRAKLATRSGRFLGHLSAAPKMLNRG